MTVQILRLVSASALGLLGACQASGPVYQTYYLPAADTLDATALVRAAETRCVDHANAEAQDAFDRTYRNAEVSVPRPTSSGGNVPSAFAMTPSQSAALVAGRMASVKARQAQQEAWNEAMTACMDEAGFRQITTCVSRCEE
jgi:hypothetical protein